MISRRTFNAMAAAEVVRKPFSKISPMTSHLPERALSTPSKDGAPTRWSRGGRPRPPGG